MPPVGTFATLTNRQLLRWRNGHVPSTEVSAVRRFPYAGAGFRGGRPGAKTAHAWLSQMQPGVHAVPAHQPCHAYAFRGCPRTIRTVAPNRPQDSPPAYGRSRRKSVPGTGGLAICRSETTNAGLRAEESVPFPNCHRRTTFWHNLRVWSWPVWTVGEIDA
jgi:hypothetical protein